MRKISEWPTDTRVLLLRALLLLALFLLLPPSASPSPAAQAGAEQRVALVIGNAAYPGARLANPVHDAEDMAAALRGAGFEVAHLSDASQRQMERALRRFGRAIQRGGVGLFYFAGHGVQVAGHNYLIPVDADIESADEIEFEALDLARVLAKMEAAHNAFDMVFLDACRNNPYSSFRGLGRGLAITRRQSRATLISYATDPGQAAQDGKGRNSPYTRHLVEAIRTPGLKVEEALKRVARDVNRETAGHQTPWLSYSLLPDFYFVPATRAQPEKLAALPPAPPSVKGPQAGSGLTLEDLQAQAKKERAVRAAWEQKFEQMQEDYAKVEGFEKRGASRALEQRAWQRFLAAYPENDPYTDRDEALRKEARQRLSELAPKYALLTLRSNVADDLVVIDGQRLGPTGAAPHQLAPGRHTVRVEKQGYRPYEKTLTLAAGESETLSAVLAELQRAAADMVEVPGGEFFAGCNAKVDSECRDDEKPGRMRSIDTFWIDRTEVTVASYAECVDAGTCSAEGLKMPFWKGKEDPDWAWACNWGKSGRRTHPINCVNWGQAKAYCQWRGKRLPTEWEWEKAARGTDGRKYPWGNRGYGSAGQVANIADRTAKRKHSNMAWALDDYDDGYETTAPVGSFPAGASPYGALDMMGNVWEWTRSEYDTSHDYRVVRGGSWLNDPRNGRASIRRGDGPRSRYGYVGFRCAQ